MNDNLLNGELLSTISDNPAFTASSTAILVSFAQALGAVENVTRSNVADTGKYTYRFADLGDVYDECKRACQMFGLAPFQVPGHDGDKLTVTTILLNAEGDSLTFAPMGMVLPREAQAYGSALTYARRYSLLTIFSIAPEDDDGHEATVAAQTTPGRRTEAERMIRELVAQLEPDARKPFTDDFRRRFGAGLSELPASRHGEALTWSREWKWSKPEEDAADAKWVAEAQGTSGEEPKP